MQPVGQLHDDDARVLRDGEQHLAIALHLPLLRGAAGGQLRDLGQPVDDGGDLSAKLRLDVGDRDLGVLDDVVDQSAGDRDGVELQLREDLGDLDAVGDVWIARVPGLAAVGVVAEPVGAREQLLIQALIRAVLQAPPRYDLAKNRGRHAHSCARAPARAGWRPAPSFSR